MKVNTVEENKILDILDEIKFVDKFETEDLDLNIKNNIYRLKKYFNIPTDDNFDESN